MSYKTILVHVDQSPDAAARIALAARLAIMENAHLVGVALTGVSRYIYQGSSIELARTVLAAQLDILLGRAHQALEQFDAIAAAAGVLSYEKRLVDDDAGGGLVLQARYADLVVLGQSDRDDPSTRLDPDLPAYVVLNCARPVLIVPYAGEFGSAGRHPLIAWDESLPASRAVANALPLLRRAQKVTLAVFNSPEPDRAGDDIALYLARHGVNVEVTREQTDMDVGNALLSLAADLGSDLLVTGGYGHARFREVLLGGVTQTLLASMTVPVLMSH